MTAIRFYTHPVSNFAAKVEIVLRLKRIAFVALAPPDGYGSPAYKAIVPAGTIPAIVDGDLVLSESETIVEYLEEAYGEPRLLPGDPAERARLRLLARFHDTRLEPPLRALFAQMNPFGRQRAAVDAEMASFRTRLADLARMTRPDPWLGGARLTLADTAYPATLHLARRMFEILGDPLALPPALEPWRARLEAVEEVAVVLRSADEAITAWLRSKNAL